MVAAAVILASKEAAPASDSTRELGLKDDDKRMNPQGGVISLGHPLVISGTRLLITATKQLERSGKRYPTTLLKKY